MENTKKPIAPELRKLECGEPISYPIRRASSVETTIGRIQRETKGTKESKMFSYRTIDVPKKIGDETIIESFIEVTRVS